MYHMADLMAADRHQFVVVHQVHQGAEYADRTVAAGEGVDVHDMVDLEVERQSVDLGDPLGQPLETCAVFGRFVGDGVVGIHPFDRFAAQLGNVLVAQCHGFGHVLSRFEQFSGVEFPAADHIVLYSDQMNSFVPLFSWAAASAGHMAHRSRAKPIKKSFFISSMF